MILKDTVVQRILNKKYPLNLMLAIELGVTQDWICILAKRNEKNNPLTTVASITIIKKDMGVIDDSEVLEKETHTQDAHAT
jgi:hypothetical protein